MDPFVVAEVAASLAVGESRRRLRPERKDTADVIDTTNDARFVGGGIATVHIDGDPVDVHVTVPVTFAGTLMPGDRVVVEYDSPRGAVISGKAAGGGNVVPSGSLQSGTEVVGFSVVPVVTVVPDSTETVVRFGAVDHVCGGVESFIDLAGGDAWLSVPTRGIYSVSAGGSWQSLLGTLAQAWIIRYTSVDTEISRLVLDANVAAEENTTHNPVRVAFAANAGDRFRVVVWQESGFDGWFGGDGSETVDAHLSVHWVTACPETAVPAEPEGPPG